MDGLQFRFEGFNFLIEGDGDFEFHDCRHLYNFLNYLYRTDTEIISAKTWGNLVKTLHPILESHRLTLMSAVTHIDQGIPHLHGLYLRQPRMRGNPFAEALLSSDLKPRIIASF